MRPSQDAPESSPAERAWKCWLLPMDQWMISGGPMRKLGGLLSWERNLSAVCPHTCWTPSFSEPSQKAWVGPSPRPFLKMRGDIVYEASGIWWCLWAVFAWFTLKAWIWEPHAWGGEGCSDGYFAWLCIFLGVAHSTHFTLNNLSWPQKHLKTTAVQSYFWCTVRNHWAKNILCLHVPGITLLKQIAQEASLPFRSLPFKYRQ